MKHYEREYKEEFTLKDFDSRLKLAFKEIRLENELTDKDTIELRDMVSSVNFHNTDCVWHHFHVIKNEKVFYFLDCYMAHNMKHMIIYTSLQGY